MRDELTIQTGLYGDDYECCRFCGAMKSVKGPCWCSLTALQTGRKRRGLRRQKETFPPSGSPGLFKPRLSQTPQEQKSLIETNERTSETDNESDMGEMLLATERVKGTKGQLLLAL